MEESENRRERLKALRMEAAQAEVSNDVETSAVPGYLSNPLIETSATLPTRDSTPRFDFYTDPMAAFSTNKKRSKLGNQITKDYFAPSSTSGSPMAQVASSLPGPRNPCMTPPPEHQLQGNYSFDQRMYPAECPFNSAAPHRSPIGMASPFSVHCGNPESRNGSGRTANHYYSAPHQSPRGVANPFPMHQRTPETWHGSGGTPSFGFPSYPSRGDNLPIPGFGPIGSPSSNHLRGRGPWHGNSPSPCLARGGSASPSSGRGRGRWYGGSMSPGSGRSSGRGLGFRSHGFAQDGTRGPECFYEKSMVEDPWQHLQPVVWQRLNAPANNSSTPGSSNSWLPKSISTKKPKVSEASDRSSSRPSLAEYLAASFNEAVNDTSSV